MSLYFTSGRPWRRHMAVVGDHIVAYPTPSNINYTWGFGSLAGLCLAIQILTGVFLAMHYTPHVDLAFSSVEHIMRDVNNGWLLRYVHSNGASIFFMVVYCHIARGLYYGSYYRPRHHLWSTGVLIFFLMVMTAFMGYVLPWGQMSFWGATVITNLVTAIPLIGPDIAYFLWGGFSVGNPTLNRFFSLHFLLPFLIAGVVFLHLSLLHQNGSSNPVGHSAPDRVFFYPYFYVKDLYGLLILFTIFTILVFFYPNLLGHPDNYREADPLVTPSHIVPEWYLLPFYAVLRSIPNKLLGVVAMALAIFILLALPLFPTSCRLRSSVFRPSYKILYWIFVADVILLGWIGGSPVEEPYLTIGRVATVFYFVYFVLAGYFATFESIALRSYSNHKKIVGYTYGSETAQKGISMSLGASNLSRPHNFV